MTLLSLKIENFRNYSRAELNFSPGANVICGDNAQGKTNLLEAIHYLSSARSFRGARDRELVRLGTEAAYIEGEASGKNGGSKLCAGISGGAKRLSHDGIRCKKVSEFTGRIPSVVFGPEDLSLVKGAPSDRRKMLDLALCQLRPRYAESLSEYNRVLDMKSALLKQNLERRVESIAAAVDVYNVKLAERGAAIALFRSAFVRKLEGGAAEAIAEISGGERFSAEYSTVSTVVPLLAAGEKDEKAVANAIYARLGELYRAELESGTCLSGTHKDDVLFSINGRQAKTFASQGQSRSAVIALKLAERDIFDREFGEPPLLLLDDVLSELDPGRQDYVLNRLGGGQVFLTCCDDAAASRLDSGSGRSFTVKSGTAEECDVHPHRQRFSDK